MDSIDYKYGLDCILLPKNSGMKYSKAGTFTTSDQSVLVNVSTEHVHVMMTVFIMSSFASDIAYKKTKPKKKSNTKKTSSKKKKKK